MTEVLYLARIESIHGDMSVLARSSQGAAQAIATAYLERARPGGAPSRAESLQAWRRLVGIAPDDTRPYVALVDEVAGIQITEHQIGQVTYQGETP